MFDESPADAWKLRYGSDAPALPELHQFLAHRSVRHFSGRPVTRETIQGLVASAQSAATSSNLQLWSVITVQNSESRERMAELCGSQKHVKTCGVFFAFIADVHRMRVAAQSVGEKADGLDYTEFFTMAVIDASLAAERLVCAAESLGLGICYIGGLRNDPQGVKELLKLPDGTFGIFGLCVGWPSEPMTAEIKPRLSQDQVWFEEQYQENPCVAEYDERMKEFYDAQNMNVDVTWSMRSGRRIGVTQLTGREVLLEWLQGQGFLKR